jgi:chorismate mutase
MKTTTKLPLSLPEKSLLIQTLSVLGRPVESLDINLDIINLYRLRLLHCLRIGLSKIDNVKSSEHKVFFQVLEQEEKVRERWREATSELETEIDPITNKVLKFSVAAQQALKRNYDALDGAIDFKLKTNLNVIRNEIKKIDLKLAPELAGFIKKQNLQEVISSLHSAGIQSLSALLLEDEPIEL